MNFITGQGHIVRRVNTKANHNYNITDYGYDNLYPQRMEELYLKSPLTKQAIQVMSEFCMGLGWLGNGDKEVNRFGETFNDMLRLVSMDLNLYSGFSLYLDFNATGKIVEIQHVPFSYVRLGSKDEKGLTSFCMISNNWEEQSNKFKTYSGLNPERYELFNPNKAKEEALKGGKGQVFYWTPKRLHYPLSSFDAARDAVQTDAEIQAFGLANIQNGFLGATLFKYPGNFDSEKDRNEAKKKIEQFKGAYGANSIMIVETAEDFTGSVIEQIPANNNDKLFESTGEKTVNTILQTFGVPGPLLAVNPQGSVFTQEQIRDSYIFMNLRTENKRLMLERAFKPVADLFGVRLGKIEEKPWEIPGMNDPKLNGDPNQLEKEEEKEDTKVVDIQKNGSDEKQEAFNRHNLTEVK
jgi:hypothetical protein